MDEEVLTFERAFSQEYLKALYLDRLDDAKFKGLDGIGTARFSEVLASEAALIEKKVLNGSYRFTRYKEKLILKTAYKAPRQISIPTIRDALTLRALCNLLTANFEDCRMRPPHDCTKRIASAASKVSSNHSFLRMDVVNYYPSINHEILCNQLTEKGGELRLVKLVKDAISNPTGFDQKQCDGIGVPQGLSISNILSMIYLDTFDKHFSSKYAFFRYVDDILLIVDSKRAYEVHNEISGYLAKNLALTTHRLEGGNGDKTAISNVDAGTEYLGYEITRTDLRIRQKSYKKMFRAIIGCPRPLKGKARVEQVIWRLNLIITGCRTEGRSVGWVFFFRQSTDKKQFHRMDVFVRQQLKEYGLGDYIPRVKRFSKAYHETRFNRDSTSYIPDFDNFTLADKIKSISLVQGTSQSTLGVMKRSEVDEIYWRMIKREVAKLERETVDFGSYSSS
jgi:retron-type reverse transcriptase